MNRDVADHAPPPALAAAPAAMSLRLRLLASLLGALAAAALLLGGISYRHALAEAQAMFDYQLRQMALSLRDQGEIAPGAAIAEHDFIVQIWSADGRTIYASRAHAALPTSAVLGFATIRAGGDSWRSFAVNAPGRVIQVAQPLQVRQQLAADAAWRAVLPLAWVAPPLALLLWWLVARALAPLDALARGVRARAPSDAASLAPLPVGGLPAEVAPLVAALNALLQRLGSVLGAQRAFVADAAHELRSPLTALKLQLQWLERAPDEAARAQALRALAAGVERAQRLVEQLLTLARHEHGAPPQAHARLDLGSLVRDAMVDAATLAIGREVQLELDATDGVCIDGDAAGIAALVRNLVDNAIRHSPRGARVQVTVQAQAARPGQAGALLRVDDSGPGIAAAERERVFERFWRRGEPQAAGADDGHGSTGSGLGLAIVRSVAERHAARLRLADSPLGGLRVELEFPAAG